jgi:hypothetical protein
MVEKVRINGCPRQQAARAFGLMRRLLGAGFAACSLWAGPALFAISALGRVASGQASGSEWNSSQALALVSLATRRRAEQFSDTGLVDYKAIGHGYVTFLAQIGAGFLEEGRVIKVDELMSEIYWHAPNQSKQRIIGLRDTLLLPADIQYYRDRFGIYQNNLPDLIRTGDGQDIRDVPHPLSPAGLPLYDFQIADSLVIHTPGHDIHVVEVTVRPKDDRKPRVIGMLFIDPDGGQVVRMEFTFTHAAFLDNRLDAVDVVLENRLVADRYWLPSHQEIKVQRSGTRLDFPVRGIIRVHWDVGDYTLNLDFPRALFTGPEIVQAPAAELATYPWEKPILDSLPADVGQVLDINIRELEERAHALVRAQALARVQRFVVSAPSISDFVRVDRVEGLAPGFGLGRGLAPGLSVAGQARYGLDDHALKGTGTLSWDTPFDVGFRVFAEQDFRDVGDEQERSTVANSLMAQEFGSDDTDPYGVRAYGVAATARVASNLVFTAQGSYEREEQLQVHSTPADGDYDPTPTIDPVDAVRLSLRGERQASPLIGQLELSAESELRTVIPSRDAFQPAPGVGADGRFFVAAELTYPEGNTRFVARTTVAAVSGFGSVIAPQERVFLGGPTTGPGYQFYQFVGTAGFSQRFEFQAPVPFPSIPLGRFGKTPATATLAPFAGVIGIQGVAGSQGLYPLAGLGLLSIFDLLRVDVARGFRDGRWTFNVDVTRDFWKIL